jgi:hypothetical protein
MISFSSNISLFSPLTSSEHRNSCANGCELAEICGVIDSKEENELAVLAVLSVPGSRDEIMQIDVRLYPTANIAESI